MRSTNETRRWPLRSKRTSRKKSQPVLATRRYAHKCRRWFAAQKNSLDSKMIVLETDRLLLSHLSPEADAEFIFRLVNDPSFIRYIGDKKVRTLDDARQYIQHGPVKSYQENGFGLNKVELKE